MLELAQVEGESCPGCGWHESLIEDESTVFGPVDRKCPLCAASAQWARVHAHEDEKFREKHKDAAPATPQPSDGRWSTIRQLSPDEIQSRGGGGGNQD